MSLLKFLTLESYPYSLPVRGDLQLWLDASSVSTITTGATFILADKSGNGNNASEVTNQPTTGASIGGKNALTFDGVNDKLTVSASASLGNIFATGGTVFFVGNPASDGGGNLARIFDKTSSGPVLLLQSESGATLQPRFISRFSSANGDWKTTANSVDIGSANLVTVTYDASSTANDPVFIINETTEAITEDTAPVGTPVDDSAADLTIGNSAGGTRGFEGLFGELLMYDRILSSSEIALVQSYLVAKWGI